MLPQKSEDEHARSYVPAIVAIAVKRVAGVKFLFDMRGFWADERFDRWLPPENGRLYRIAKNLERRFLEAPRSTKPKRTIEQLMTWLQMPRS